MTIFVFFVGAGLLFDGYFSLRVSFSNLKRKVEKLDTDKLANVQVDLSKLSNAVKNDVVKKAVYNAKIKTTHNAKINEVKGEIPSITNLATTTAFTAVENKIPNVSNLVKKTDYNRKVNEIEKKTTNQNHDKYITTPEFNKLTAQNFAARLAQANLATLILLILEIKQILLRN